MTATELRLVEDYAPLHSVHIDRIRDYTEPKPRQPIDIAIAASKASADLKEAIVANDRVGMITANRRLVAIGGLAKGVADVLEAGR